MKLTIIILAAGEGTRMRSSIPKMLHTLGGTSMLEHVINTAKQLSPEAIYVIYGHKGTQVQQALSKHDITWVKQSEQLGTGHAVAQALPQINDDQRVLVLVGDTPLISVTALEQLLQTTDHAALGLLTTKLQDPSGLGRIIRDIDNNVIGIIEEKDANAQQKKINEIWTGFLVCPAHALKKWLAKIDNNNAQQEYYLPSIIAPAIVDGTSIQATITTCQGATMGINNKVQLAEAERALQKRIAEDLMRNGVTLLDPARFDCRGKVIHGNDVTIDINVILEGDIDIGNNCQIGANCYLRNVRLADNVVIKANSIIEDSNIGNNCQIGPFARIRPETILSADVRIGNFVEIKKSTIAKGSKINHLSYIGDTTLGENINVGAGTITCNYDGANKHQTIIEDNVFIGSNTALVAPLTIAKNATIGAGSTITKNVGTKQLAISRGKQQNIDNWQKPIKRG